MSRKIATIAVSLIVVLAAGSGLAQHGGQGSGKELPVGGFVAVPPQHPHFAWADDPRKKP
jgi:hypothetical protein